MALNDSLNKLPSVIGELALTVENKRITVLTKTSIFRTLIVGSSTFSVVHCGGDV